MLVLLLVLVLLMLVLGLTQVFFAGVGATSGGGAITTINSLKFRPPIINIHNY